MTRRERIRQYARYLQAHYPVAYPVSIRFERGAREPDGTYLGGQAWRKGHRFYLRINPTSLCLEEDEYQQVGLTYRLADTLIHEWAHFRATKHAHVERQEYDNVLSHSAEWGVAYAEMYSDWCDHDDDPNYRGGGWEASRSY